MIAWTAESRQKLAPRTPLDLPPVDGARILPKLQAAWKKRRFAGGATWIDKTTPADPKVMGTWIRSLAEEGLAPMVLALAREVAGPLAAFEAGLAAQRGWYAEPVGWEPLRALALGIDDRPRAMALAEADFEKGNLATRLCVAHVFFDRPEWANAVAKQIIEDTKIARTIVSPLFASLADFDLVAPLLAKRKGSASLVDLVETFGDRMLDVLLTLYTTKLHDPADVAEALALFTDERAAARLAKELIKKKSRSQTLGYFARHPSLAGQALGPIAAGRSKAALMARETLETTERSIANATLEEASMDDVPEALRAPPWLAKKRARKPRIDPMLRIDGLTRPVFAGKALPMPALVNLLGFLERSTIEEPHPMLAAIVSALDPRTRAELGWELARHWELRPRKRDQWMIDSLVVLADDEITRRTSPAMKHPRIYKVLGFIGTDAAAYELLTAIARLAKSKRPMDARVPEMAFEGIAAQRGMSVEELEDALVPALPIDDRGGFDLDYGGRTVRVVFDAHLQPIVLAPNGAPLKALPDKGKNDDPEKVRAAKRHYDDLLEDVAVLAERRLAALERAMVSGRTWPYATWKKVWAGHVLMAHLARAIVWQCGPIGALRLAEDGSLAGDDDAIVPIADDARIGVAHPAELGAEGVARWTQILSDYRLLQPFEQIARPIPSLRDADQTEIEVGPPPKPIKAFVLWQAMRSVGYAGPQAPLASKLQRERPLRGSVGSELRWALTKSAEVESVRIGAVEGRPLAAVHPIELAEALRDVERAFAGMRG